MAGPESVKLSIKGDNLIDKIKGIHGIGTIVPLLLISIFLSLFARNFFSGDNLLNVLRQAAVYAIMGCGMTFVIISGGIDLSQGSMLALCHVLAAYVLAGGQGSIPLAIVVAIMAGGIIGMANGLIITSVNIPPFIVTMGMQQILRGVSLLITDANMIEARIPRFRVLGIGYILGIPVPVILFIIVGLLSQYILSYTSSGRYIFAIGSNEEAARLSGVRVKWNKMKVYIIAGLMVGFASVVYLARLGTAQPAAGGNYELEAIAATVIGGTSMTGGEGGILGTILGAIVVAVIRNGLILLGLSPYIQQISVGAIIILAVAVDMLRFRLSRGLK